MEQKPQTDHIEGRNPVLEALRKNRSVDKLFLQKGLTEGSISRIRSMAKERGVIISEVAKQKLDHLSETGAHQGVIACTAVHEYCEVEDMLEAARQKQEPPFLIIADEISDPHNLGSILRTANAAGAHGVIIPKHRSVGLSATVAKTSAGAVEYVPVARVTNLAATVEMLKNNGVWIAGAAMEGSVPYYQADLTGALGLVIGSEGFGISRLLKEKCDFLVSIPMKGEINSLNASVAAGVLMMEAAKQRG